MRSIELINSASQTIASGGKIALGNVNIKNCHGAFSYNGTDTITLVQSGIYQVIIKSNVVSTVADQTVGYAIAYNGTVSTIANTGAVITDVGGVSTLTLAKQVKICGNNPISLTLVNSGTASTTYQNVIVDIFRMD